ncbi:MAG: hypothetical protein JXR62_05820 [Bacilli bacterium]|nr:hypothetical protein [Bacilli bacterium]
MKINLFYHTYTCYNLIIQIQLIYGILCFLFYFAQTEYMYIDLYYYTIKNITTVGFGHIYPVCIEAKIILIFTSVSGYIFLASIIAVILSKNEKME